MEQYEKLRQVRKKLKYTQQNMSDLMDVKQSYYSALERGKKPITATITNSLFSDKFNVSPEWWYNSNGSIFKQKIITDSDTIEIVHLSQLIEALYLNKRTDKATLQSIENNPVATTNKQLQYLIKFYKEIEVENIELLNVKRDIHSFINLLSLLEKIVTTYFENKEHSDNKVNSYDAFKKHKTEQFKTLVPYNDIVKKMIAGMEQFLTRFKELDSKNIIE